MTGTFQTWLRKCDAIVSGKVGLGLNDLPDAIGATISKMVYHPKMRQTAHMMINGVMRCHPIFGTHTIIQRWILHFLSPKKMGVRNDNTHPHWQ